MENTITEEFIRLKEEIEERSIKIREKEKEAEES